MLTKYRLRINGTDHEITSECIYNWDEIQCSYSRREHNGVVRAYSIDFEFVGKAHDLLLNLYLADGVKAEAELTALTLNDDWTWDERFTSPLDFSTISWDGLILSISAIDNSLAAMISARKTTKYEFVVGEDIPAIPLQYDRVRLTNTISHEIIGDGVDQTNGDYVDIYNGPLRSIPVYSIGEGETFEGSPILYHDQDGDDDSFFLEAVNKIDSLDLYIEIESKGSGKVTEYAHAYSIGGADIYLMSFQKGRGTITSDSYINRGTLFHYKDFDPERVCVGTFDSYEALLAQYPTPPQNVYAIVGDNSQTRPLWQVYYTPVGDIDTTEWIHGSPLTNNTPGQESISCQSAAFIKKIHLSNIPKGTCFVIRGIVTAPNVNDGNCFILIKSKIKASWNSRGKTVAIDALSPQSVLAALIDKITEGKLNTEISISDYDPRLAQSFILGGESIRAIPGAKFYTSFDDFSGWMKAVFGYSHQISEMRSTDGEVIHKLDFLHRNEIFGSSEVVEIEECREFDYTIDVSLIHNAISVGYNKQDYETECGRDEWNFTNNYTTDIVVKNADLSLISKYRADCYGIEFLAQKRTRDTTDDKSDSSVFFAHCKYEISGPHLVIDRSVTVTGVLSDTVFNGEYSPRRCVEANAGYIAAMGVPVELMFASGDGNTEVEIDGQKESADLTLESQIFTCGRIEFETDHVDFPSDPNTLIKVSHSGITYTGFIKEAKIKYAKAQAAEYDIIVKDMELWR